jgi:hypothetical protein
VCEELPGVEQRSHGSPQIDPWLPSVHISLMAMQTRGVLVFIAGLASACASRAEGPSGSDAAPSLDPRTFGTTSDTAGDLDPSLGSVPVLRTDGSAASPPAWEGSGSLGRAEGTSSEADLASPTRVAGCTLLDEQINVSILQRDDTTGICTTLSLRSECTGAGCDDTAEVAALPLLSLPAGWHVASMLAYVCTPERQWSRDQPPSVFTQAEGQITFVGRLANDVRGGPAYAAMDVWLSEPQTDPAPEPLIVSERIRASAIQLAPECADGQGGPTR